MDVFFWSRECINIVCETAGLKTVDKKRKVSNWTSSLCLFQFLTFFLRLSASPFLRSSAIIKHNDGWTFRLLPGQRRATVDGLLERCDQRESGWRKWRKREELLSIDFIDPARHSTHLPFATLTQVTQPIFLPLLPFFYFVIQRGCSLSASL